MDEDTGPIKLKQRKPRSEAQIQALEKARAKAADMRESRNVIRQKHGITDETDATPEETENTETDEPEAPKPEPKAAVVEKKETKPKKEKPKPEPKPKEPEPEPEEVKQYRREVQEAPPPTPKQHFRMVRSMNKSYMLYDE
jgi:hypothetical protein